MRKSNLKEIKPTFPQSIQLVNGRVETQNPGVWTVSLFAPTLSSDLLENILRPDYVMVIYSLVPVAVWGAGNKNHPSLAPHTHLRTKWVKQMETKILPSLL